MARNPYPPSKYDECACGERKTRVSAQCQSCRKKFNPGMTHPERYQLALARGQLHNLCDCGAIKSKYARTCFACRPRPKGGRYTTKAGYVMVFMPEHHRAHKSGYVFEHIVVIEKHLGRELIEQENVHHKNGIKDDNAIDNLELWTTSQPPGQRVEDKLKWAQEFLERYRNVLDKDESWLPKGHIPA